MGLKAAVVSLFVFAILGNSAALAADPASSDNLALLAEMAAAKQEMLDLAAALEESGELTESGASQLLSKVAEIEGRLKSKLDLPAASFATTATNTGYDSQYRDAMRANTSSYPVTGAATECPPGSCLPPMCTNGEAGMGRTSMGQTATSGSNSAGPVNRQQAGAVKHLSVIIREDGASEVDFSGFSATQVSTLLEFLSEEIFVDETDADSTRNSSAASDSVSPARSVSASDSQDAESGENSGSMPLSADNIRVMALAPLQEQLSEQQFGSGFSAGIDLAQGRVFGSLGPEGPLQLRYSLAADGSAELAIAAQDIDVNALGEQGKEVASSASNRLARMAEKLEKALRGLFD